MDDNILEFEVINNQGNIKIVNKKVPYQSIIIGAGMGKLCVNNIPQDGLSLTQISLLFKDLVVYNPMIIVAHENNGMFQFATIRESAGSVQAKVVKITTEASSERAEKQLKKWLAKLLFTRDFLIYLTRSNISLSKDEADEALKLLEDFYTEKKVYLSNEIKG